MGRAMNGMRLATFGRNQDGSVVLIAAVVVAAVISFVSMALDSGLAFSQKRSQQTATDLAALAAAGNLSGASASAVQAVQANGYQAADVARVETGIYVSDSTLPASQRFQPATTGAMNAVRVTLTRRHHYVFGAFMGYVAGGLGVSDPLVTTRAVAAARNVAAFSIGSGLASLDQGIANSVLGALIGTTISLSVNDYQSLAAANIDMFAFSNALAGRVGITAGTYDSLLSTTVSLPRVVGALEDVAPTAQAEAALASILAAVGTQTSPLSVASLVNFGPYGGLAIGSAAPTTASTNALGLLSAVLQAANGHNQVWTQLNVNTPGISNASLTASIGERPVGSALVTVGPQGTTITTAQTRLRLLLTLAGPPQASVLTVPIILNIASGTAVANSIQCTTGIASSTVRLGVTPGIADAWIGALSDQDLGSLTAPINPPNATLVNLLGLVTVTGRSHVALANANPTPVSFSYGDVLNKVGKTVSTTDYLSGTLTSLFSSLQLNATVLGVIPVNAAALNLSILQALAQDAAPADTVLVSVLSTLGLSLGNATSWVSGVQCGQSVLVN